MLQTVNDIQTRLTPVFNAYDISRAVLFGSLAQGTANEQSDLDLLVESRLHGLRKTY